MCLRKVRQPDLTASVASASFCSERHNKHVVLLINFLVLYASDSHKRYWQSVMCCAAICEPLAPSARLERGVAEILGRQVCSAFRGALSARQDSSAVPNSDSISLRPKSDIVRCMRGPANQTEPMASLMFQCVPRVIPRILLNEIW